MNVKRLIRTGFVEKLPFKYRFPIERIYYYYFVKNYIKNEIRIIKQLCNPHKMSLDVGANDGIITLFLCKYTSHVYCFEPVPKWHEYLKQKFCNCNVTIESCALGNFNEESYLSIPCVGNDKIYTRSSLCKNFANEYILGDGVTSIEKVKVSVKRLDDLNISNIGFVKIDVEGFEHEVLKGAEVTIRREMPNIFIEIEQRHHEQGSIYDIFQYITNMGYFGYFLHKGSFKRIEEFDVEKMQNISHEKSDAYVNNFIFSPLPITGIK